MNIQVELDLLQSVVDRVHVVPFVVQLWFPELLEFGGLKASGFGYSRGAPCVFIAAVSTVL